MREGTNRRGCGLHRLVQLGTDLLLPPACNFCGIALPSLAEPPLFCGPCREAFLTMPEAVGPRCAAPLGPEQVAKDCPRCRDRHETHRSYVRLYSPSVMRIAVLVSFSAP